MTTDKTPQAGGAEKKAKAASAPALHSSAKQVIKENTLEGESEGIRKSKFIPTSRAAKMTTALVGLAALIIILLLVVLFSGGGTKKVTSTPSSSPVVLKDLEPDNNSSGYTKSPTASFGGYGLNLSVSQPTLIKSAHFDGKVGDQITWDDGFVVLATSVDRDYRPASEFNYKKISEAGDELIRVNLLVGNAGQTGMPIGYKDLAFYALYGSSQPTEPERVSEDTYSPKDGQILGGKQTQKISLHFKIKRGAQFSLTKSKTFTQSSANPKLGEEKKPVLSLKINFS